MKSISSIKTRKAILGYLEVVSLPHGDNMCNNLLKEVEQLDLNFYFCMLMKQRIAKYDD